jgi:hypothetical protein
MYWIFLKEIYFTMQLIEVAKFNEYLKFGLKINYFKKRNSTLNSIQGAKKYKPAIEHEANWRSGSVGFSK